MTLCVNKLVVLSAIIAAVSDYVTSAGVVRMRQQNEQNGDGLSLQIDAVTGSYKLFVHGRPWLSGEPAFYTLNGRTLFVGDGLELVELYHEEGVDVLGPWNTSVFVYSPSTTLAWKIRVEAVFKQYPARPGIILFGQRYPTGLNGTSVGSKHLVSTGFPRFKLEKEQSSSESVRLGYLAYGGIMFGATRLHAGRWSSEGIGGAVSGLDSGPLVLFSARSHHCLTVSAFDTFMSTSVEYQPTSASWGITGTVDSIPQQFTLWTIVSHSSKGINEGVMSWGDILREFYRRHSDYRYSDMTNNYIGYYTDNGAYYYYKTESGLNYETTLTDWYLNMTGVNLPFRYWQYDSWWYYRAADGGLVEWSARPDVFPNGMWSMWNTSGLLSVAHSRWWSNSTVYAVQNGGKYKFIVENETAKAIPIDQTFWEDLFTEARKWGLMVYEQDWLNVQFNEMLSTVSQLQLGRSWLLAMGKAAHKHGLTIQYCMAPSRHALQSLEIPVVSQARVSIDYQPGDDDNWRIGLTSLLADALGVAPFKDNFWTTSDQPGNPYNLSEPFPALHSVIATLSTGPVATGDRIGYINTTLLMRSCNSDGLILKPSKPATSIDKVIRKKAFGDFQGEVWSTYSNISGWIFGIIFAADFRTSESISVTPKSAGFGEQFPQPSVIYSWFNKSDQMSFSAISPLSLVNCTKLNFCLYVTSPVLDIGGGQSIVLYGEADKWVPMSPQRVKQITVQRGLVSPSNIEVELTGAPNEHVTFYVGQNGEITPINCVLSGDGSATLSAVQKHCSTF